MAAHVLVLLFPAQGHINCMLHFAAGLLHAGLHVTFLRTDHNRRRLGLAAAEADATSPRLRFLSFSDGLPDDHPRSAGDLAPLVESLRTTTSVVYRTLLASLSAGARRDDGATTGLGDGFPSVTCVVADGILPFAVDITKETGIPALAFRTASGCSFLAFLSVPRLVELGEVHPVPVGTADDLDAPVRGVPGMEGFLRRRDLPSFRRGHAKATDPTLQIVAKFTAHNCRARALILNTAASLERAAVAHIAPHTRDVFAVGPLHAMFQAPAAGGALWREDDGCTAWLDGHADRTVVYVSVGSFAVISPEQFTEFLS
uniref:Uncharacterized protein n=1 Tax=Avena sativa TaxID=4498 RepID=A0ACD5UMC0_AVESA